MASYPFGVKQYVVEHSELMDSLDQPVWKFLAAYAAHASMEQQQILVVTLREKILENNKGKKRGYTTVL